jgi:hypothetical protein
MKQFNGVVSKACMAIACLVTLGTAVPVKAQDSDQITAADVAGDRLSFSLPSLSPLGKAGMPQMTGTQQATLPGIPGIDSVPNFSGQYSTQASVPPTLQMTRGFSTRDRRSFNPLVAARG